MCLSHACGSSRAVRDLLGPRLDLEEELNHPPTRFMAMVVCEGSAKEPRSLVACDRVKESEVS